MSTPEPPDSSDKDAVSGLRQRELRRLGREVQRLRDSLSVLHDETAALLEAQEARPLSSAEGTRLRLLRQESDRLSLELRTFWHEFELIRSQPCRTAT